MDTLANRSAIVGLGLCSTLAAAVAGCGGSRPTRARPCSFPSRTA